MSNRFFSVCWGYKKHWSLAASRLLDVFLFFVVLVQFLVLELKIIAICMERGRAKGVHRDSFMTLLLMVITMSV